MADNNQPRSWRFYKKASDVLKKIGQLFTRDNKKFMTADGKAFIVKEEE